MMMPAKPAIVSTAMTTRTMTGSMLRYFAAPAHTPPTTRSSLDRFMSVIVRIRCRSKSPSGGKVRVSSAFIPPSCPRPAVRHIGYDPESHPGLLRVREGRS